MKNHPLARLLSALAALFLTSSLHAQVLSVPGLEILGPYSSIKRNRDGSREEFHRTPDLRTITKDTKDAQRKLRLRTIYRLNDQGKPLACEIFDAQGQRLFKSRYGYSRKPGITFGKLVEEQMFDARVVRRDPNGIEMPVRRFIYMYNADGSPQKPIAITLIPGKKFEDVFGSGLQFNPFDPKAADPNLKPEKR